MTDKIKLPQPKTENIPQGRDLFQTPNYAVDLLIPCIPIELNCVWECACGQGKISNRLISKGFEVYSTDIRGTPPVNFLTDNPFYDLMESHYIYDIVDCIITNPPFSLKKEFYKRCMWWGIPFALLIPADYSGWVIEAVRKDNSEKIIPTRRIDYITPTGLSGKTGHTSNFHSQWLTNGFGLGKSETFVDLTKEMKENI
jgi:hypothetical protein